MRKRFHILISVALMLSFLIFCAIDSNALANSVLVIPDSLISIEAQAFAGDSSICSVFLPEELIEIGERAFSGTSLRSITFPKSLTSIADNAFEDTPLQNVTAIEGSYAYKWAQRNGYTILPAATDMIIDEDREVWKIGDSISSLSVTVVPDQAEKTSVKWSSTDESVVNVNTVDGLVRADMVGLGEAYLIAELPNGITRSLYVLVNETGLIDDGARYKVKCNRSYVQIGEPSAVLFTVRLSLDADVPDLFEENTKESFGTVHDDGKDGDIKAGDGVYSLQVKLNPDNAESLQFYASIRRGYVRSNKVRINAFYNPSSNQEDAKRVLKTIDEVFDAANKVLDSGRNAALNEAETRLKPLLQSGEVLYYTREKEAIFARTSYGLTMVYIPPSENLSLNDDNTPSRIVTYQPVYNSTSLSGAIIRTMEKTDDSFEHISYPDGNRYTDSEVTLNTIRNIGPNSIVIIHTHGCYNQSIGSCLMLAEKFSTWKWITDSAYRDDCNSERILCSDTDQIIISAGYVSQYCGRMGNSLVYLGACSSGRDETLGRAFTAKGAAAVVANTATIYRGYNIAMIQSIIGYMSQINPDTQNYNTLKNALDLAKAENGANDVEWAESVGISDPEHGTTPAVVYIIGGAPAESVRLGTAGKVNGVVTSSDNGEPVKGVVVRADDHEIKTDSSGWYEIGVTEKKSTIRFEPDKEQFQKDETLSVQIPFGDTMTRNVVILANPGTVIGHIRDRNAKATSGAVLTVKDDRGNDVTPEKNNISGIDGMYIMQLSPEGTYTITVSAGSEYLDAERQVEIKRGKKITENFSLYKKENAGWLTGYVRDAETGTGLPNIRFTVKNSDGMVMDISSVCNKDGRYSIQMPSGKYTVTAEGSRQYYADIKTNLYIKRGETSECDFSLGTRLKIGGSVNFGQYEHRYTDGEKSDISWRILDIKGDKALLLSSYGLQRKKYHTSLCDITWANSEIRVWLNHDFYNKAFNADEKTAILTSFVDNSSSQGSGKYDTYGGTNTRDCVFLLSYAEVVKYFPSEGSRICHGTDLVTSNNLGVGRHGEIAWWTRSPGREQWEVMIVGRNGSIGGAGSGNMNYLDVAVRPAMWVDLNWFRDIK